MEELRSTEILDREIQEDARKKAEKILKDADAQSERILADTSFRVEKIRKEKETFYARKIELAMRDIEAAEPLEKERFLVSFEDGAVSNAIENYMANLSEDKKLALLKGLLEHYKTILFEKTNDIKVHIKTTGFEPVKLEKLVCDTLGKKAVLSCSELSEIEAREIYAHSHEIFMGKGKLEGMILTTEDGKIRCRVTLSVIIENLMDKYSSELATTLFCGRLPE